VVLSITGLPRREFSFVRQNGSSFVWQRYPYPPSVNMPDNKATHWSITINNPTQDDRDDMREALQKGWQILGQEETGENGTVHLQFMLTTPHIRFGAVKKTLRRAHIEPAKNVAALRNYVQKEETRTGALPVSEETDKYPSLARMWRLLAQRYCSWDNKDGLNMIDLDDRRLIMYREPDKRYQPLDWLDTVGAKLIHEGFHVEHHLVNPQVRASFKRFGIEILWRSITENDQKKDAAAAAAAARLDPPQHPPAVEHNHASQDVSQEAYVSLQAPSCPSSHPESPHPPSGPLL